LPERHPWRGAGCVVFAGLQRAGKRIDIGATFFVDGRIGREYLKNMNNTNNGPVVLVKRGEFRTLAGDRMVAILVSSGAVELYRIEDGGLEIFIGYLDRANKAHNIMWITGAASALDRAPVVRPWVGHGRSAVA
jgi:hypothetical protein